MINMITVERQQERGGRQLDAGGGEAGDEVHREAGVGPARLLHRVPLTNQTTNRPTDQPTSLMTNDDTSLQ